MNKPNVPTNLDDLISYLVTVAGKNIIVKGPEIIQDYVIQILGPAIAQAKDEQIRYALKNIYNQLTKRREVTSK